MRRAWVLCMVLWGGLAWAGGLAPAVAEDTGGVYFVQISDTHLGSLDHYGKTRQIVDQINALPFPIACVVHTGDITADSIENPAVVGNSLAIFGRLKVPIHYLPGNHDIRSVRQAATSVVYTNRFGPLADSRVYQGVAFVFVDTEPLARSFSIPGFEPWTELEAALKRHAGEPILVFQHTPPVEDFHGNEMHPGWPSEVRGRWTALLNDRGVKAVIAGHFHRAEQHWLGNVPLYVAPPVAGFWGRQASFRVYEYRGGRLGYRTVYVE